MPSSREEMQNPDHLHSDKVIPEFEMPVEDDNVPHVTMSHIAFILMETLGIEEVVVSEIDLLAVMERGARVSVDYDAESMVYRVKRSHE